MPKKTILVIGGVRHSAEYIKKLVKNLKAHKAYLLVTKDTYPDIKKLKSFEIVECPKEADKKVAIDTILKNHKDDMVLPFFRMDKNSKHTIYIYNQQFGTEVDPKIFRQKNHMNNFLGDIADKRNQKLSYKEVQKMSLQDAKNHVGEEFILKPTNGTSSMMAFKVDDETSWKNTKKRITKDYTYILEEYLQGNLYSVDLYCDGSNIFMLCYVREETFLEMLEDLPKKFLEKYRDELTEEFLHFLPIRYTINMRKIPAFELKFIREIGQKLIDINYRGTIHVEYMSDRSNKRAGFIEWGARLGGYRATFIERMHHFKIENLPVEVIARQDFGRFEYRKGMYFLRDKNPDRNFVGIKTNVLEKTNVMEIIKRVPNYLSQSFEYYLRNYLWDNYRIKFNRITFEQKTTDDFSLYPFHERNDTKFNYIMELDEENHKRFIKKKNPILEHLVFHDYS